MFGFNNEISIVEWFKARKQKARRSYVSRDELEKKPLSEKLSRSGVRNEAKPLLPKENGKNLESKNKGLEEKKVGIRVKILMTKKEAAQLLSNCRDGGVLEFKHVARELVQVPTNRIRVISLITSIDNNKILDSIPEESEMKSGF